MQYFLGIMMFSTALFLILLVLVQRGRGGGLTGALGGMGGQSAFGAKAGDVFTRITMIAAVLWILLALVAIKVLPDSGGAFEDSGASAAPGISAGPQDDDDSPTPKAPQKSDSSDADDK